MKTQTTTTGAGNTTAAQSVRTTCYTNANAGNMPDETQFTYVIEVSAWADAGTAEYIGIIGQPTRDELHNMLASEMARVREWLDDEPEIALVRQRPQSANGDFPPSHEWPIVIDYTNARQTQ